LLLAGCAPAESDAANPRSTADESTPTPSISAEQIAGLTFRVELAQNEVVAGGELDYLFTVRNDSGGPITVPSCETSVGGRGLVPVSEPDAELWLVVTVDCQGPHVFAHGAEESWTDTVYARDKYGTALEPGEYLVGREVPHVRRRLLVPVTVVAPA